MSFSFDFYAADLSSVQRNLDHHQPPHAVRSFIISAVDQLLPKLSERPSFFYGTTPPSGQWVMFVKATGHLMTEEANYEVSTANIEVRRLFVEREPDPQVPSVLSPPGT